MPLAIAVAQPVHELHADPDRYSHPDRYSDPDQ
jgi:hypothetical protein